jgi:hypothetical protein
MEKTVELPKPTLSLKINGQNDAMKMSFKPETKISEKADGITKQAKVLLTTSIEKGIITESDAVLFIAYNDFNAINVLQPESLESKKLIIMTFSGFDTNLTKAEWFKEKGDLMEKMNMTITNTSYEFVKTTLQKLLAEQTKKQDGSDINAPKGPVLTTKAKRCDRTVKADQDNERACGKWGEIGIYSDRNEAQVKKLWADFYDAKNSCKTGKLYLLPEAEGLLLDCLTDKRSIYGKMSFGYGDSTFGTGLYKEYIAPCMAPQSFWQIPTTLKFPETVTCKGLEITADNQFKMTGLSKTEPWKGIIPYVVKQLAWLIFTGKSIVQLSLPVRIFEPLSMSNRIKECISTYPYWAHKANAEKDPIERVKFLLCAAVNALTMPIGH